MRKFKRRTKPSPEKKCPKCGEVKDRKRDFYRNRARGYYGIDTYCIACEKEMEREYYLKNREAIIARVKAYQERKKNENKEGSPSDG